MMIVINETTVLTLDKVLTMMIKTTPKSEKVLKTKGFLGLFPEYETIEQPYYTLEFEYERGTNKYTFTNACSDYAFLKTLAKEIVEQVRKYDSTLVDRAFEEAVLKE